MKLSVLHKKRMHDRAHSNRKGMEIFPGGNGTKVHKVHVQRHMRQGPDRVAS